MGNCCATRSGQVNELHEPSQNKDAALIRLTQGTRKQQQIYDIKPNEQEKKIFDTLLEVVSENGLDTTLRVAGGWVRDKLLGKESEDIDISLDDIKGIDFVKLVDAKINAGKNLFGTTKINKNNSKHFMTSSLHIHGISIDFVNFWDFENRDSYANKLAFATEDALRRDITINCMFYNINESKLEDFTGQGLHDLRNGIIRTPLAPVETFSNTPLSILRSVRFASRFEFDLDPEMFTAIKDPRPRENLASKTCIESRGDEIVKIIGSKNAGQSVTLLGKFDVLSLLYAIPGAEVPHGYPELQDLEVQQELLRQAERICQIVDLLFKSFSDDIKAGNVKFSGLQIAKTETELKDLKIQCMFTGLLFPLFEFMAPIRAENKAVGVDDQGNIVKFVLMRQFKRSRKLCTTVYETCLNLLKYSQIEDRFSPKEKDAKMTKEERLELGWFTKMSFQQWPAIQIIAFAIEYKGRIKDVPDQIKSLEVDLANEISGNQNALNDLIVWNSFDKLRGQKPLVNAKRICEIMGIEPGHIMKHINDELMSYQIANPDATRQSEEEYLKENKDVFIERYPKF